MIAIKFWRRGRAVLGRSGSSHAGPHNKTRRQPSHTGRCRGRARLQARARARAQGVPGRGSQAGPSPSHPGRPHGWPAHTHAILKRHPSGGGCARCAPVHLRARTRTDACARTYASKYMQHTRRCTRAQNAHTHARTHTGSCMHAHAHTRGHASTHSRRHKYMHTHVHVRKSTQKVRSKSHCCCPERVPSYALPLLHPVGRRV